MLDVNFLRESPEKAKNLLSRKKVDPKLVDKFLRLDEDWRKKTVSLDELKAEQNTLTKEIGSSRNREELLAKAQILKKRIAEISEDKGKIERKRDEILGKLPNVPFEDVTVGLDENENKVIREVGKRPDFGFEPKDYFEIAESLGLINTEKASEVSGTRFGYLMNEAALIEFALARIAFDTVLPHGFIPVIPPVMIRPEVYESIGRLAADQRDERYFLEKDNVYLVGSAEHTLIPIHFGETLSESDLPRRYVGFSTCFRREAGSYGKDTKGILRVHQFDKVEFISFTTPEKSEEEHLFLLSLQEELMKKINLPYRVVENCTGDMGWTDARQFDIEAWFPSQGVYRETHSCSNTTDFQSRGAGIKYKTKDGKKEFVHALNATGFSQRPILSLLENFQTKDGTIRLPEIFGEYLGKREIKRKN